MRRATSLRKATGIPAERVSFRRLSRPPSTRVSTVNRLLSRSCPLAAGGHPSRRRPADRPVAPHGAADLRLARVRRPAVRPVPLAGRRRGLHHGRAGGRRDGPGHRPLRRGDGEPRRSWSRPRQLVPQGASEPLDDRGLRLVARRQAGCWSSPTPSRSGGSTPGATTGCSTGPAARSSKLGGADAKPSTLMFAKFSPDGGRVGYVRENNLYVEDLATGTITAAHHRRLPHAHQRHLRLGVRRRADELLRRRLALEPRRQQHRLLAAQRRLGEELQPDQQHRLALLQGHPGAVPQGRRDQLGGAGRRGERRRRATRWLEIEGDPRNHYIARMDWAASPTR